MKGGYFLLDGLGVDLSSAEAQSKPGAYAIAEKAISQDKPLVMCNCVYGTAPVSPVPGFGWRISASEIVLVGATLHVHVKSDDTVTVLDVTQ